MTTPPVQPAPVLPRRHAGGTTDRAAASAEHRGASRWVLITALAPVLWGTTYLVTSEALPAGRPLTSAVLRALPAGLLLVLVTRQWPGRGWAWRMVVLGALNIGVFFALLFLAAYRLPGGTASTLTSLQPMIAIGLGWLWLAARPRPVQVAAAALGVVGVTMVVGGGPRPDVVGAAAAVGAAMSMAAGVVLIKRWRPPVTPLSLTGWQLVLGGVLVLPIALVVEGRPPAMTSGQVAGYVYLGIFGTGLAYAAWSVGVRRLPVAQVSMLSLLSPLTAAALGWAAADQALTGTQITGGVVVLLGVVMSQRGPGRPAALDAAAPAPPPVPRTAVAGSGAAPVR